jgi:hypothetical protein
MRLVRCEDRSDVSTIFHLKFFVVLYIWTLGTRGHRIGDTARVVDAAQYAFRTMGREAAPWRILGTIELASVGQERHRVVDDKDNPSYFSNNKVLHFT